MQVLIFVGEGCYPQRHLEDILGTASHIPSTDEVVSIITSVWESSMRWDRFSTGQIDWVSALVILDQGSPQVFGWNIVHAESEAALLKSRILRTWQDSEGGWHAIIAAEQPPESLFNLPQLPRLL